MDSRAAEPRYYSLKGPFLSEPLDSAHSVRFSKFDRFELLISFSGREFGHFSWIAESVRFFTVGFQFTISRLECFRPNQAVPPSENLPSVGAEKPADGGLLQIGCRSLDFEFDRSEGEIADSLRRIFEVFPFSGDGGRRLGSICTAWRTRGILHSRPPCWKAPWNLSWHFAVEWLPAIFNLGFLDAGACWTAVSRFTLASRSLACRPMSRATARKCCHPA